MAHKKMGQHYSGMMMATNDNTFTTGISEIPSGTAENYFKKNQEMISDISHACTTDESERKNNESNIIGNVSAFMTDRHVVEKKQNELWEVKIKCAKQDGDYEVLKLHCSIHPLLQFSEVCERTVWDFEKAQMSDSKSQHFLLRGETGTVHTVRSTCKLFFKDGVGDPLFARAFLEEKGILFPLVDFNHSRFNILFKGASGVFYLKQIVIDYLQSKD